MRQPQALRTAKKLMVIVSGFAILSVGIAVIVLPGPAPLVVSPVLGSLGIELISVTRLSNKIKATIQTQKENYDARHPK